MVVYFSGTGNSKYCAEKIAAGLNDEIVSAAGYMKNGIAAELISGKPWIFVCPIYAWQMPAVFADFIRSGNFDGNRDAYFVLTCGGESGNAAEHIEALCAEKKLNFRGSVDVIMPDNYIVMFNAPAEEESKKIIDAAQRVLNATVRFVSEDRDFPRKQIGFMDKLKSGAINKGFSQMYIKSDKFRTTDKCASCGKCVDLCPLGNIELVDGKPKWGGKCTLCMACICYCPAEAIEYGKSTVGKRRYRFPM